MARPTRVLHYFKIYRPTFTGEGVFLERCSAFMQPMAPHVEHDLLVTTTPEPESAPAVCSTLDKVIYLTRQPIGEFGRNLALAWWLVRNFHRYKVIHARVHADWWGLTYIIAKLTGRRLVLSATLIDSVPQVVGSYRKSLQPLARWLFRLFDAYISISPKLHQEMTSAVDPAKCHLVPCGISLAEPDPATALRLRARLGIPADAIVLVFVGGLCRRKDPLLLVRSLPAILRYRADTYLMLVGPELEPDYVQMLRQQVREDGTDRNVVFVGEVNDPHPYYEAADIMVFASHTEGFGTAVPEAMSHRLPIVVRHLPGVNDLFVIDGETGFFFREDSEYAPLVLGLIADPALRASIGSRGQALATERFDMRKTARRYLNIYGIRDIVDPQPSEAAPDVAWQQVLALPSCSSIVNRRFHTPATPGAAARPMLLTVIDAEEAFDWNEPCSPSATDVATMGCQYLAHRVFERYGIMPIYAVDYPVATQDAGRRALSELLQDGLCDVGTQLHAWVTPPFLEQLTPSNTFSGNLPPSLELAKTRAITTAIEDAFGRRPRVYRAGRYGAGRRTSDILLHLGYRIDASVMPHRDFRRGGGPDFTASSAAPYWTDPEHTLLELPGSTAIVGRMSGAPLWLRRAIFSDVGERFAIPAALAHSGLIDRIRLTPEGTTISEAKRLVRFMLARGDKIFLLSYHSPSLAPGNTPYVRTADDLQRFLGWLDEFYDFFAVEIGGSFVGWQDVLSAVRGPASPEVRSRPTVGTEIVQH